MTDRDLFGNPPKGEAYARRTDPETAQEAARRASYGATKREAIVYKAAFLNTGWMTTLMLEAATGINRWSISPRLKPMARKGLIERKIMVGINSLGKPANLIHIRAKKKGEK
jgi:hypothetical protein